MYIDIYIFGKPLVPTKTYTLFKYIFLHFQQIYFYFGVIQRDPVITERCVPGEIVNVTNGRFESSR